MYIFNEKEFNEFRKKNNGLRYFQALNAFLGTDRIEVVFVEEEEFVREDTFHWGDEVDN